MTAREEKRIFAVTGKPVLHSRSPAVFNAAFVDQAVDARYTRLAAVSAREAVSLFQQLGLCGLNVTAPFKKDMIDFLDSIEPAAAGIGGVNTVVKEGDLLKGYNTDYLGVVDSLRKRKIELQKSRCVVLGAGGAGRAAAYGLVKAGAQVTIVNRTYEKAVSAADTFGCRAERIGNLESLLLQADILVSTLSPLVNVVKEDFLRGDLVVFDANYITSPISGMAAGKGCLVIKGEEWLLNQAIPAYKLFIGREAPAEVMEQALHSSRPGAAMKDSVVLLQWLDDDRENRGIGREAAKRLGRRFQAPGKFFSSGSQNFASLPAADRAWILLLFSSRYPVQEDVFQVVDLIVNGEKEPSLVEEHIFQELSKIFAP